MPTERRSMKPRFSTAFAVALFLVGYSAVDLAAVTLSGPTFQTYAELAIGILCLIASAAIFAVRAWKRHT